MLGTLEYPINLPPMRTGEVSWWVKELVQKRSLGILAIWRPPESSCGFEAEHAVGSGEALTGNRENLSDGKDRHSVLREVPLKPEVSPYQTGPCRLG